MARVVLIEALAHEDFTWETVDVVIWAVLEQNIGIICACIPTLRPIMKKLLDVTGDNDGARSAGESRRSGPVLPHISMDTDNRIDRQQRGPDRNNHPLQQIPVDTRQPQSGRPPRLPEINTNSFLGERYHLPLESVRGQPDYRTRVPS